MQPHGQPRQAQAPTQEGSPDDLLTIPEAAELLKVSAVTISRWRRQGKLQAYKVGPRAVRIRRGDLLDVFSPYVGPESTLAATGDPVGASADQLVEAASGDSEPMRTVARATLKRSVIDEAASLRAEMLERRGGTYLTSAFDDGSRVRDKRRKRR